MTEEFSFEGISIIKKLYITKNSIIYLVNDVNSYITDQYNKINVFKSILKSSISTKDYEMLKRERSIMIQIKIKDFQNLFMHIKIYYIYIWKYHLLKD